MNIFKKIFHFFTKKRINPNSLLAKRIRKFKSVKRGYYSLLILLFLYIFSFFLPLFVGNQPIYAKIKNEKWDEGEKFTDTNNNGKWDPPEYFEENNGKYDKGEEFTDINNNGKWDKQEKWIDVGNNAYDIGEQFKDLNRNGLRDDAEVFIDSNKNGMWDKGEEFNDIGNGRRDRKESYIDSNENGKYDKGEEFNDIGNGKWDDAEPFTDRSNKKYDQGEKFIDCGINPNTNNIICDGDDTWDSAFGNGKWDDAEPFIDINYIYNEGEKFIDCNETRSICSDEDGWESSMGNGKWDDAEPLTDEYKVIFPAFNTLINTFSFGFIKTEHYSASEEAPQRLGGENITSFRKLKNKFDNDSSNESTIIMPFYPYDPTEEYVSKEQKNLDRNSLNSPSQHNWFGTDNIGRDVFARIMYGFNVSISFAIVVTFLSYLIGVSIGATMGYFGGRFDLFGQRVIEVFAAIPFLYVMMIVSQMMEPNFLMFALLLVIIGGWISISYYIRGEFFREKAKDYVSAAVSMGGSTYRIMFKHILPNALTPIITFAPFAIIGAISTLVSLDYLGFVPQGMITWGEVLKQGNEEKKWFLLVFPLSFMATTLFMITFIGEAVREAFDPKVHSRLR